MSRIYPEEAWADADVLLVDDLRSEMDLIVGEMNGHVDVDNIPQLIITGAKVELDAFHEILYTAAAGPDTLTRENTDTNRWFVLESGTLTTGDGFIEVEGSCTYDCPSGSGSHCEIGVRVAGEVCARSGSTGWLEADSPCALGCIAVPPGDHLVELVFRITPGEYASAPTASLDITVNQRVLYARYVAR